MVCLSFYISISHFCPLPGHWTLDVYLGQLVLNILESSDLFEGKAVRLYTHQILGEVPVTKAFNDQLQARVSDRAFLPNFLFLIRDVMLINIS